MSIKEAQCIYCLEKKPATEFNTEHVIQHSMTAGIQDNLTLIERVCADCNSYFDKHLDRALAKDTIHGLDRLREKIKPISKLREFTGRNVDMQTASDHADLDGAPVNIINRNGELTYALKPHLVIEIKGDRQPVRLFREDLLNDLTGFDLSHVSGRVKFWAETEEEERELWDLAQNVFTKLGHPLQPAGTYIPGTIPVFAEVEFGIREFRTFAKVAFNYMARVTEHIPGFALLQYFDDARQFIRHGTMPQFGIVQPIGNVGRYGILGQEEYPLGHFADARLHRNGVVWQVSGRVTLFNRFGWLVMLCPDYRGLHYPIDRMHHWNFQTMRCEPFAGGPPSMRNN